MVTGMVMATSLAYDPMNRLTSESTTEARRFQRRGPIRTRKHFHAPMHRRLPRHSTTRTSNFTCDNTGQLLTTSGIMPGTQISRFAVARPAPPFDPSGNRTTTGYSTGTDNQMHTAPAVGNYHYEYADEGNQTTHSLKSALGVLISHDEYTWDFRDCMTPDRLTKLQSWTDSGISNHSDANERVTSPPSVAHAHLQQMAMAPGRNHTTGKRTWMSVPRHAMKYASDRMHNFWVN